MYKLLLFGGASAILIGAYLHYTSVQEDLDDIKADLIVSEQSNNLLREAIASQSAQLKQHRLAASESEKVLSNQLLKSRQSITKLRKRLNEDSECFDHIVSSDIIDSLPK